MRIIAFTLALLEGLLALAVCSFMMFGPASFIDSKTLLHAIAAVLAIFGGFMALKRKGKAFIVLSVAVGISIFSDFVLPGGFFAFSFLGPFEMIFGYGIPAILAYLDMRKQAKQTDDGVKA